MMGPLNHFCLACARFANGDRLGEALAVLATSPYFVIYHVAVLLHARRELHMAFVLLGMLLVSVLSSAIKKALKHPRPTATCSLLGNCHKHGMPSSHSSVMAFAATTCLLLYLHRQRQISFKSKAAQGVARIGGSRRLVHSLARMVFLLEVQGLMVLTAAVGYGRVHLGYHTLGQVAAGMALGTSWAAAWWQLTLAICQRWSAPLLALAPLRALHFRNTLGSADVHAAEAALFGHAAQHAD